MKTLHIIMLIVLCLWPFAMHGQIKEVQIGVNGLTCSQCTRSVEMSIRKLPFVQDVEMNLEHTSGRVTFKPDARIEVERIAQAVFDAGFSVRGLQAIMQFDGNHTGHCVNVSGDTFVFLKTDAPRQAGDVRVRFIGEKYLLKKEYKTWKPLMKNDCGSTAGKVYYVSM